MSLKLAQEVRALSGDNVLRTAEGCEAIKPNV